MRQQQCVQDGESLQRGGAALAVVGQLVWYCVNLCAPWARFLVWCNGQQQSCGAACNTYGQLHNVEVGGVW